MPDHPSSTWIILAVINAPLYWFAMRYVFGEWEAFKEALVVGAKPAWWCWMNGELADHRQGNLKILLLFVMCAGLVIGEGWLLTLAFG